MTADNLPESSNPLYHYWTRQKLPGEYEHLESITSTVIIVAIVLNFCWIFMIIQFVILVFLYLLVIPVTFQAQCKSVLIAFLGNNNTELNSHWFYNQLRIVGAVNMVE